MIRFIEKKYPVRFELSYFSGKVSFRSTFLSMKIIYNINFMDNWLLNDTLWISLNDQFLTLFEIFFVASFFFSDPSWTVFVMVTVGILWLYNTIMSKSQWDMHLVINGRVHRIWQRSQKIWPFFLSITYICVWTSDKDVS